jgi:hypothetical protein
MESLNLPTYLFRIKEDKGKKYIFDKIRRRFVQLTPEEWVRQHVVDYLVQVKNFPCSLFRLREDSAITAVNNGLIYWYMTVKVNL